MPSRCASAAPRSGSTDADEATARLAADLGAGKVVQDLREAKGIAGVAVLAVPPAAVARTLAHAQDCAVADWYTDVASVKELPVTQARDLGCDLSSYVPGHPLAGRERHGPAAGRADLFLGRTWALCPLPETSPGAVDAVLALVLACGADPVPRRPGDARPLGRAGFPRPAPGGGRDGGPAGPGGRPR